MATYLAGSNVQADAMQTLYLVNPGYVGYADASNTGNMVLISPSTGIGQVNPLTNSSHQQHYIGSLAGHQNSSVNLFTSHPGNQTYNSWTEVGELSFLPSNDVNQVPPSLGSRITALNSGQQASLIQNGGSLGLNMENSQASAGSGQGLSLSLSTQQSSVIGQLQTFHMQPSESGISSCAGMPHATSEDTTNRGERSPNKWVGNLSSFRASSRDGALAGFSSNPTGSSRHAHLESGAPEVTGGLLNGSKYLKAAQQLLDEVVSVGRGIKSSSTKNTKLQSWKGTGSMVEGSVSKDRQLSDMDDKDGVAGDTAAPTTSAPEQNNDPVSELSPTQRQELQLKKAKLMAMVDEVDRRYRQYYNQMQIVVTSFESAAGLGAAKTYTALALQTISRHFRCLRDAISGQIRLASRALGEEDLARQNSGKGETSRLRYVDQQLRQQRALQQLGMMQQHAWRPQRGLPERSVSVLRAWLFEHFLHPYPKDSDKIMLARQTGLTRSQVSNWFINARVRLWKPMVEEMYVEETREAEMEAGSGKGRQEFENMNKGVGVIDAVGNPSARQANGDANKMVAEQQNASDDFPETAQASNQSKPNTSPGCDPRSLGPGPKKARQDSGSLLSPNTSMDADLRSEGTRSEGRSEVENKQSFTISHNELVRAENLGGFGSYQIEGLNRNSHAGLAPRYPASSGVSLTLGLQHCEGLSLSGAQAQQYLQGQGRRLDAAASNANEFYGINHQASAAPYSSNYDATNNLQNRKRLATQLFPHNFVA